MGQTASEGADAVARCVATLESFLDAKADLRVRHPLRYLFWEATLRCNLTCRHCGSDCVRDNASRDRELQPDMVMRELDSIASRFDPATITFAIIGGEPLIREDIINVGAHARDLGFYWGITTNGLLLDERRVARLKAAGLRTISVSVDGLKDDHDRLRRRDGAFARTIAGIERLLADRFWHTFDVICCVSRLNIERLEPFVDAMAARGVPQVRFTPVFARGRAGRDDNGLMLGPADYRRLLAFVAQARAGRTDIRVTLSEEGYYGPEWECRVRDTLHYCGSGVVIGSILHDGSVTGCPSVSRRFSEGNIRDRPFLDVWDTGLSAFRERRRELFSPTCGGCEHWDLCEGGGFHLLEPDGPQCGGSPCGLARLTTA